MKVMAFQIIGVSFNYLTVVSEADQRKHQSSGSLAFVQGIHRWPVNSPHKRPVTRKMFPFDDVMSTDTDHSMVPLFHLWVFLSAYCTRVHFTTIHHTARKGLLQYEICLPLKLILKLNLGNSCLFMTCISVSQSFWNFAQSTAVILLCSVQTFKTIEQLKH